MSATRKVQAIQRAVHVLELVANSPRGLRLAQVASTLGMPKQTAHKTMETLVAEGLLDKAGRPPCYVLTSLMSGLRSRQQSWNQRFLTQAASVANRMCRTCNASVFLSQFAGGEALCRLHMDPAHPEADDLACFSGAMAPYGTGIVFQAYMSEEELRSFRRRHPLDRYGSMTYWRSYKCLDAVLDCVRREGCLALLNTGSLRVILPILKRAGGLWGAFTICVQGVTSTGQYPVRRWIEMARLATADLSDKLA